MLIVMILAVEECHCFNGKILVKIQGERVKVYVSFEMGRPWVRSRVIRWWDDSWRRSEFSTTDRVIVHPCEEQGSEFSLFIQELRDWTPGWSWKIKWETWILNERPSSLIWRWGGVGWSWKRSQEASQSHNIWPQKISSKIQGASQSHKTYPPKIQVIFRVFGITHLPMSGELLELPSLSSR